MPKRTVLFDLYQYRVPLEGEPGKFDHLTAARGEVIDVDADEAARGEALGALGDPADLALADAERASDEGGVVEDAVLGGYNVDQMAAYLAQHPGEADHVGDLEAARSRPRKGVLELVDRTRSLFLAEVEAREAAALAEGVAEASGAAPVELEAE